MIFGFLVQGCHPSETKSHFNYLDIAYFDVTPLAYSLRFTSSDTVFYLQFFSNYPTKDIVDGSTYYVVLEKEQKEIVDSFMSAMNFREYMPAYKDEDLDGEEFKLIYSSSILQDSVEGEISRAPLEIRAFISWVKGIRPRLKFSTYQGQVNWSGSFPWPSPAATNNGLPKVGLGNEANEQ